MRTTITSLSVVGVFAVMAMPGSAQPPAPAPQGPMSFFITSAGPGDGANLGGLEGADAHCQQLAADADRGDATWHAYLSQAGAPGLPQVHARDRIGEGPWYNARGVVIAWNVDDLHEDRNNIRKPTALNERGEEVNGAGDQPNQHDILTGSDSHGRAIAMLPASATTCDNWTSNAAGSAIVGHHDRSGANNSSWNSAHGSRSCSQPDLVATGGAGLFYCFAAS